MDNRPPGGMRSILMGDTKMYISHGAWVFGANCSMSLILMLVMAMSSASVTRMWVTVVCCANIWVSVAFWPGGMSGLVKVSGFGLMVDSWCWRASLRSARTICRTALVACRI